VAARRGDATGSLFPVPESERETSPRAEREEAQPVPSGPFAAVALNRPLDCEFTYAIPEPLADAVAVGVRVAVPFGPRREIGVVVGISESPGEGVRRVRAVQRVLDAEPVVGEELLGLTRWMADEYACSWGEALAAVLPAALKREGGRRQVRFACAREGVGADELAEIEDRWPKQHRLLRTLLDAGAPLELRDLMRRLNIGESPLRSLQKRGWIEVLRRTAAAEEVVGDGADRPRPELLTPAQERAVEAMVLALRAKVTRPFLLQGITGSGKTEVYLRVLEYARAHGRGAIVVVPEIALTPQTVGWFRSRFGDVAVLHSRLTDAQRHDAWMRIRHGEVRVVVGARSALFAPVVDLGVVVVDEEHEPSFKQANVPRYHAREVAAKRAELAGAVCVLGTATPCLESWHRARRGLYHHVRLEARVGGGALPAVEIVDMTCEPRFEGRASLFSRLLRERLAETLKRGEQAILFQNRRGFHPVLWCRDCKLPVRCPRCDMGLTWHRRIKRLVCHSCCDEVPPPKECPACTSPRLVALGAGAEQVEAVLAKLHPDARMRRMDSDTMLRREDYEEALDAFRRHEVDVLVGTQMIAKGLDFPRVTLVGIVDADSSLHLPDFRGAERTFQLIAQVAGRAGRGALPGRIVVQTQAPEQPAVKLAARHDFDAFAELECASRDELAYPPHGRLIRALVEHESAARCEEECGHLAAALRQELEGTGVSVLGPAPAPFERLRGRHRWALLVKARLADEVPFARARQLLRRLAAERSRARVVIDVDPMSML
jgi:primosomal protein N' (replication factor Y)